MVCRIPKSLIQSRNMGMLVKGRKFDGSELSPTLCSLGACLRKKEAEALSSRGSAVTTDSVLLLCQAPAGHSMRARSFSPH